MISADNQVRLWYANNGRWRYGYSLALIDSLNSHAEMLFVVERLIMKQLKFTDIVNKENIISGLLLTLGAIVAAFAVEEFLVPNHIFDGGVTGISMILEHYLKGVPLGLLIVILNLPFMIFGILKLGKKFIFKAIYSIIIFSVMTSVFVGFANATEDVFLATIFGGVFLGAGVGLVFRGGGCLDGTEVVAIYMSRKLSVSTSSIVFAFNVIIYATAGIVFGLDRGMYSLVMYFITSQVINVVEKGLDNTKSVMIITNRGDEIAEKILSELGRTVTFINGKGMISKDEKSILYCVITRGEIFELKKIIHSVPGSTFTTISEVSEIVGNHIKSEKVDDDDEDEKQPEKASEIKPEAGETLAETSSSPEETVTDKKNP